MSAGKNIHVERATYSLMRLKELRKRLEQLKELAEFPELTIFGAGSYPKVPRQLCILDCDIPESEIQTKYPRLMQYLNLAKQSGVLSRYLVQQRQPLWYSQERREPAPFLCTYMGRGRDGLPPLRFIWNKSNAVATNTYLMLYPREALASLVQKRPELEAELFEILTRTAREVLSTHSRVHAGGLRKIEPRELVNTRLASAPAWLRTISKPKQQPELWS